MPRSPYGAYFTLRSRRQRMIAAMRMRLLTYTICILYMTNIAAQEKPVPAAPVTQPAPTTVKPAAPAAGSDTVIHPPKANETQPAASPAAGEAPAKPGEVTKPAVVAEPKPPLTEEELRAQKEAELKAQRERELAAEKARAEEARRIEESKTFFDKLYETSVMYTGLNGGLGLGLNRTHKTGYGFGMTLDYLAFGRYGFHFGAETGIYPTKTQSLNATPSSVSVVEGGTFGYLNLNFAALYVLPAFAGLEPAVGAGIALYQLRGGTYDFNQTVSPFGYASLYYNLLSHLQVGFITHIVIPSASKVVSASSEYQLGSSLTQTALGLHLSLRYRWF